MQEVDYRAHRLNGACAGIPQVNGALQGNSHLQRQSHDFEVRWTPAGACHTSEPAAWFHEIRAEKGNTNELRSAY